MGAEYTNGPFQLSGATAFAVDSTSLPFNADISDNGSGSLYAEGQAVTAVQPQFSFESRALDVVLGAFSLTGECIGAGEAITSVAQYMRNLTNCQSGAASNLRYTVAEGLGRLANLNATRGEDAVASVLIDAISAGVNAPVALATGVALPGSIVNTRFTLGQVYVAGNDFDEIDSVSIDFGVEATAKRVKLARLWPQSIGVLRVRPRITFTGRDASRITDAILTAGAQGAAHANTEILFKKRGTGGASFVADGTAQHIVLTIAGLNVPDNVISASGTSESSTTSVLNADFDGTNAPITIDIASTYAEN